MSALASTVAPVWMASTPSPVSVCLDSLAATASMTSTSATPSPASMAAHVLTVMEHISAPVLLATLELTVRYEETTFYCGTLYHLIKMLNFMLLCLFRISSVGVILPRVRMGDRAGSRERLTPASARLGGQVSIATSPVSPVKLQPNSKVNHSPLRSVFLLCQTHHSGSSLTASLCDFRHRCGSPVQKLWPVSGCRKHTLLSMPGWLHRQLLPGTSG